VVLVVQPELQETYLALPVLQQVPVVPVVPEVQLLLVV
jgi:hypothetical protein